MNYCIVTVLSVSRPPCKDCYVILMKARDTGTLTGCMIPECMPIKGASPARIVLPARVKIVEQFILYLTGKVAGWAGVSGSRVTWTTGGGVNITLHPGRYRIGAMGALIATTYSLAPWESTGGALITDLGIGDSHQ